ncbi:MAG: ribosomal subunit protein [Chloroflexota bacterium]|jgi:large subunit ribosomal protein L15|nr:MAG: 50S ribosomal protein L15 [Chloroflexota bacterium]RLT47532.1 MAG: 50S ribosomal protein L15 [Chloroflexota bacterium]
MKLHDLKPAPGSRHKRKRLARGHAAGQGKTAGRGTKGAGARRGTAGRLYREGGNLPLVRKLPFKRGFTNIHKVHYTAINLDQLQALELPGKDVTPVTLAFAGYVKDPRQQPIVVLGRGKLLKALNVRAHRFSEAAAESIRSAGGTVDVLPLGEIGVAE